MLRRLSLGLLASAISVAFLPAIAQEDGGGQLGVMSISHSLVSSLSQRFTIPHRRCCVRSLGLMHA